MHATILNVSRRIGILLVTGLIVIVFGLFHFPVQPPDLNWPTETPRWWCRASGLLGFQPWSSPGF